VQVKASLLQVELCRAGIISSHSITGDLQNVWKPKRSETFALILLVSYSFLLYVGCSFIPYVLKLSRSPTFRWTYYVAIVKCRGQIRSNHGGYFLIYIPNLRENHYKKTKRIILCYPGHLCWWYIAHYLKISFLGSKSLNCGGSKAWMI